MHLYLLQPGAEHSLMPTVALHPLEVRFNNLAMAAMVAMGGYSHSHSGPLLKNETKLCMDKKYDLMF